MRVSVLYSTEAAELEIGDRHLVTISEGIGAPPVTDVAATVAQAIEQPQEFPPLRQAVVPGDHVTILLDDAIPNPGAVLDPIIECLIGVGVLLADVRVVQVSDREDGSYRLTSDSLPPGITLVKHDARDRNKLSYLASTKSGTRVYLNREVVDADLVILVGRAGFHPILGYSGTSSVVFPGVADAAAQQQFLGKIFDADTAAARAAVRQESEEITWLLGVQFAVQLVVGKNDQVVSVAAGHWNTVQQQTRRMLEGTWQRQANRRVDMVIATIRGGSISQGFEELGKALDNARMLVNPGGRIAVLSAIAASPGPSLRAAREMNNAPKALDQIRRHPPLDAISTWQIMRACSHARVYLLSRLAPDVVEELSITPVESVAELQRLVSESGSCAVLNDAPLVRVTLEKRDGEASG